MLTSRKWKRLKCLSRHKASCFSDIHSVMLLIFLDEGVLFFLVVYTESSCFLLVRQGASIGISGLSFYVIWVYEIYVFVWRSIIKYLCMITRFRFAIKAGASLEYNISGLFERRCANVNSLLYLTTLSIPALKHRFFESIHPWVCSSVDAPLWDLDQTSQSKNLQVLL